MSAATKSELVAPSILKRVAAGDRDAVEECIKTYGRLVWSFARKINSNVEDAEDVAQEIFLSIWQNAGRYDEKIASETTFIGLIARRRMLDRLRAAYRKPQMTQISDESCLSGPPPIRMAEQKIDASKVIGFLQLLRPEQRELIWLNFYQGMSHREIAQAKKMPVGTVKTHVRRGLTLIREMLVQNHANRTFRPSPL